MKKIICAAVCGAALFSASASSAELSTAYQKCLDDSGGVTAAMLDCVVTESEIQDKELNRIYGLLMKSPDVEQATKDKIKAHQRAWIKYRNSAYEVFQTIEGTMYRFSGAENDLQILVRQVTFLESIGYSTGVLE